MGYEQHHIVEQNDDNLAKNGDEPAKRIEKFGEEAIDDPSNIVWIPRLTHEQITAEYNSGYDNSEREENGQVESDEDKNENEASKPIKRSVINALSFDEQRAAGLDALRRYGVLK